MFWMSKFEDLSELESIGLLSKNTLAVKKNLLLQRKSATEISVFCLNGAEFEKISVGESWTKSRFTWTYVDRI